MADNKQWFKVWTSILTDPSLSYLHNQSVGTWLRLCALTAQHGTNGVLTINSEQLLVTLHLTNATQGEINKVFSELKTLNISVSPIIQKESVTLVTLHFLNWGKYQAYSESYERVNKFRQKKSVTVKKRYTCNVEEKREEEKREEENKKKKEKNINTPLRSVFIKPDILQIQEYCKERKNIIDAQYFYDKHEANGWRVGKSPGTPMKDWKATIRTWEKYSQSYGQSPQLQDNKNQLKSLYKEKRGYEERLSLMPETHQDRGRIEGNLKAITIRIAKIEAEKQ